MMNVKRSGSDAGDSLRFENIGEEAIAESFGACGS